MSFSTTLPTVLTQEPAGNSISVYRALQNIIDILHQKIDHENLTPEEADRVNAAIDDAETMRDAVE